MKILTVIFSYFEIIIFRDMEILAKVMLIKLPFCVEKLNEREIH